MGFMNLGADGLFDCGPFGAGGFGAGGFGPDGDGGVGTHSTETSMVSVTPFSSWVDCSPAMFPLVSEPCTLPLLFSPIFDVPAVPAL